MAIIIDETKAVCVQGITGREGRARTKLMRQFGTNVVGGCTPGKGGQEMQPEHLAKVRQLRALVEERGLDLTLTVDGGVKAHNAMQCVDAGADTLVAGSAVFNETETPQAALQTLRDALTGSLRLVENREGHARGGGVG